MGALACDATWGDASTNPTSSSCRKCITGQEACPPDCTCDPACDEAPTGSYCLRKFACFFNNTWGVLGACESRKASKGLLAFAEDVECATGGCNTTTLTCSP